MICTRLILVMSWAALLLAGCVTTRSERAPTAVTSMVDSAESSTDTGKLNVPESAAQPETNHSLLAADAGLYARLSDDLRNIEADYRNYYSMRTMAELALAVGMAAPIANTQVDRHFRNWYQQSARGQSLDEFANVFSNASQWWIVMPVGMEIFALAGRANDDYSLNGGLLEWSNRSLRGVGVGLPPVIGMMALLGSTRPPKGGSQWQPFQAMSGVSGHTFMGAIPFLTAAAMAENPCWKCSLVAGSFLGGWSRVNNDRHYMSQAALGWWMAFLANQCVSATQDSRRQLQVEPTLCDGVPGLSLLLKY